MKVAITGASGYIGNLLAGAHVARGDTVHALARNVPITRALGIRYFQADLASENTIPREFFDGADVLYHCAAELTSESLMQRVNVQATRHLLAAVKGSIGHWVQLSTAGVYGNQREGTIGEDAPVRPAQPYARSKADADRLVEESCASGYAILRPVAVIGRHMVNRSIHAWLTAIDRGMFFFVGASGAIVNYVAEQNVIGALIDCATRRAARNRIYNLSQDCAIEAFVSALSSAAGLAPPRLRIPEAPVRAAAAIGALLTGFPLTRLRIDALTRRVRYPATRIENDLGYRATVSIDAALTDIAAVWKHERTR